MESEKNGLTRREFLKGSAVTAAALGVSGFGVFSHAKAEMIGPEDTITAAIIGVGGQGSYLLGRAVKVPNVKWVACCDIQPKNLERGLSIAKGAEGYDDYRKVLDRKDIQAVIIATPICLHAPMAVEAMRSGKHVMCEKMMAYTIDDAKQMYRVSRQTGKKLQIGHQRRYNPDYQHAYKMVQDGVLGKITHVRAQWNRNGSWRRACKDPSMEKLINWRLYRDSSQGLMAELGSHQIDVVNWMLGEAPTAVMGCGGLDYWKDGRDVLDNVQVIFEYASGVKFQYQSLTTNQFDGFTEQIMGDQGTMILSPGKCLLYREPQAEQLAWEDAAHKEESGGGKGIVLDASKTPRKETTRSEATAVTGDAKQQKDDYLLELEDFFMSIRDGHAPLCGPKVALETCVASIKANEAMDVKQRLEITAKDYQV